MKKYLPSLLFIAALLLIWQFAAGRMNAAYILPTPVGIIKRLWELREPLFTVHLPATMSVTMIGLAISVVLGISLAIVMDMSPVVEQALYPIVIASQTIPTTAIAPLFIVWFGYGIWSKIVVTILMTFFPITITVFDGFKSVKREMEELLITYGAGKKERVIEIMKKLMFIELLLGLISSIILISGKDILIQIFGGNGESEYYRAFAEKAITYFLSLLILSTFNKGATIFLQATGDAKSASVLSLIREIVMGVGLPIILSRLFGLDGLLWFMPIGDLITAFFSVYYLRQTKRRIGMKDIALI